MLTPVNAYPPYPKAGKKRGGHRPVSPLLKIQKLFIPEQSCTHDHSDQCRTLKAVSFTFTR